MNNEPDSTSRRTLLAALVGGTGLATGGMVIAERADSVSSGPSTDPSDLTIIARAVYPSAIDAPDSIVSSYLESLRSDRVDTIGTLLTALDRHATHRFRRSLSELSIQQTDALLRSLGVHRAQPVPNGTLAEQIRYHLVNGLLITLYRQPVGTSLVGIENPRGHPGGYATVLGDPEEW